MKTFSFLILLFFASTPVLNAQSWVPSESNTNENLNSVYILDQHYGWTAGYNGTILHTSDGGETWEPQNSRTSENLNHVHFFDELRGWIAGDENTLIFTDDGGSTWSDRRPSSVPGQNLNSVHFIDWKRGFTAGGPGKVIYHTDDAGLTWQRIYSEGADHQIHSVQFIDQNYGWAVNSAGFNFTEDGGSSWSRIVFEPEVGSVSLRDIFFVNDSAGYVIANDVNDGFIFKTENRGENWELLTDVNDAHLLSIFFSTYSTGWISDSDGVILRTDDSGLSWDKIRSTGNENLTDIHFTEFGSGAVVGSNGTILQTHIETELTPPPYDFTFPFFQLSGENETIELLNRTLFYLEHAEEFSDPLDKRPFYVRTRRAISEAEHFYRDKETPDAISKRMYEIITHYLAEEHNSGADIFNKISNTESESENLITAGHHFVNAIILQPDSSQSYKSLAYVFEEADRIEDAIHTFEMGMNKAERIQTDDFEYLINLYLLNNDEENVYQSAKKAVDIFSDEIFFKEIIAEHYMENNRAEDAVDILNDLIALEPGHHWYRLAKADQNYRIAFTYMQQSVEAYEQRWQLQEQLFGDISPTEQQRIERERERVNAELERLHNNGFGKIDQVIANIKQITETDPNQESAHALLGLITRSRASFYISISTLIHSSDEIELMENSAEADLINARIHYEKAAELNPNNREYFEALFRIYQQLGMDNRASEIKNRF